MISIKNRVVILILFLVPFAVKSQDYFDFFNAKEKNGKVFISLVIKAGNTCQGIEFYRSIDSLNYEMVGRIGGVCGSLTEPVFYTFTDQQIPSVNQLFYKANLPGYGYSQVVRLEIYNHLGNSFYIGPNPVTDSGIRVEQLEFPLPTDLRLLIVKTDGKQFMNNPIFGTSLILNRSDLPIGLFYLLIITSDNQVVEKKLLLNQSY